MLELLRGAFESGAFGWAIVLAAVMVVGSIVKHGVLAAPAVLREWSRRMVIRQAICGRTKAERDQAYRVLGLLESGQHTETDAKPPPDAIDGPDG